MVSMFFGKLLMVYIYLCRYHGACVYLWHHSMQMIVRAVKEIRFFFIIGDKVMKGDNNYAMGFYLLNVFVHFFRNLK